MPACFEKLAGVHLNMVTAAPDEPVACLATEPNAGQRAFLNGLRFTHLLDHKKMPAEIEPRPTA